MDKLITIVDAAAILKINVATVMKMIEDGTFKVYPGNDLSLTEGMKEKQETEDAWVKVKEIFAEAYENKTYFD